MDKDNYLMGNYKPTEDIGVIFDDQTGRNRDPKRLNQMIHELMEVSNKYDFDLNTWGHGHFIGFKKVKEEGLDTDKNMTKETLQRANAILKTIEKLEGEEKKITRLYKNKENMSEQDLDDLFQIAMINTSYVLKTFNKELSDL